MWYNEGMDASSFFKEPVVIATLVLACVTAILAIGTFITIRQNKIFREKDRKERLLNEIIEWASSIAKSAISRQTIDVSEFWKAKLEHKYHKFKGKYIEEIVSSSCR